ncbi:AaceriACR251Cp [[Ashbya] aceris (nom. inval.)]|nr:AaceriACR251Cp [[Ashbya] aceris (nom. inval.)]
MRDRWLHVPLVLFAGAAILAAFGWLKNVNERSLDQWYAARSHEILHKFDGVRRYDQTFRPPKLSTNSYLDIVEFQPLTADGPRENATLLMLCRNWELPGVLSSMRSLEDRFNGRFHYDWVFLNDVPFDVEFVEATSAMASGRTFYGLVPEDHWDEPGWIDPERYERCLQAMIAQEVPYAGSRSYRNMCRFNSGFFFRHELLDNYDYYFRVEPEVAYFCDFPYDPFRIMREHGKKYGFVITLTEYEQTVPTLWQTVREFAMQHPEYVNMDENLHKFVTDGPENATSLADLDYNMCHFWSNFEIGDLNFFRSPAYLAFFEHLDRSGGFYYERWGDAPVHSLAAALLLRPDEVHHFENIGYYHVPYGTCPAAHAARLTQRCICEWGRDALDVEGTTHTCLDHWWRHGSGKFFLSM